MSASENQIVVYQPNETMRLDVRLENETVWLNRHQMAQLFGRDVKTIGKHIANALKEELADLATMASPHSEDSLAGVAKSATTQGRRPSHLRCGKNWGGSHSRPSRFNPQGNVGKPRIWKRKAVEVAGMTK